MAKELLTLLNKRRVRIAIGIMLLVMLTGIVLVQSFFTAGASDKADLIEDSDKSSQEEDSRISDVITSTQDVDEALKRYMDAHYYLSDEERRAMGLNEVEQPDPKVNPGDDPDG